MNIPLPFALDVTVQDVTPEHVVFVTSDQQILRWPTRQLPATLTPGMRLQITVATEAFVAQEREKIAKAILNQILASGSEGEEHKPPTTDATTDPATPAPKKL